MTSDLATLNCELNLLFLERYSVIEQTVSTEAKISIQAASKEPVKTNINVVTIIRLECKSYNS